MKKSRFNLPSNRTGMVVGILAAAVLVAGSFSVASGADLGNVNSMVAAVFSGITGKPVVVTARDASSPTSLTTGNKRLIAKHAISVKNVSHWATVNHFNAEVRLTGAAARNLNLTNVEATYHYCVPSGMKYGYGYQGGRCGGKQFSVIMSRKDDVYTLKLVPAGPLHVYPEIVDGQITIYANLRYSSGISTKTANLYTMITGGSARADQCQKGAPCTSAEASIRTSSSRAVTVARSYGYGYCSL